MLIAIFAVQILFFAVQMRFFWFEGNFFLSTVQTFPAFWCKFLWFMLMVQVLLPYSASFAALC